MSTDLPDFIVIGAMKCGTTSLHYYLRSHPDIFMPREKELDYFSNESNYEKGESWYRSKFQENNLLNGEASPNYTKAHLFKGIPEKMYQLLPNVKLIYLYRDPVERAYSHYIHSLSSGREKKAPEEALTADSNYLLTSRYYWQLNHYLKFYPRSHFLLIDSDELKRHRKKALSRVYRFLNVDDFYEDEIIEKNRHSSKVKTKRSKINSRILSTNVGDFLKKMIPEEGKLIYKKLTEKKLNQPELPDPFRQKLKHYFEEDQKLFSNLIEEQKTIL